MCCMKCVASYFVDEKYLIFIQLCPQGQQGVTAAAKKIEVNYLIINVVSSYNIILGYLAINALWEVISTWYLVLNYLLLLGESRRFEETDGYLKSVIRIAWQQREKSSPLRVTHPEAPNANFDFWDPRLGTNNERLAPMEDLNKVRIGPSPYQATKIGTSLSEEEEHELVDQLTRYADLFSWAPLICLRYIQE